MQTWCFGRAIQTINISSPPNPSPFSPTRKKEEKREAHLLRPCLGHVCCSRSIPRLLLFRPHTEVTCPARRATLSPGPKPTTVFRSLDGIAANNKLWGAPLKDSDSLSPCLLLLSVSPLPPPPGPDLFRGKGTAKSISACRGRRNLANSFCKSPWATRRQERRDLPLSTTGTMAACSHPRRPRHPVSGSSRRLRDGPRRELPTRAPAATPSMASLPPGRIWNLLDTTVKVTTVRLM